MNGCRADLRQPFHYQERPEITNAGVWQLFWGKHQRGDTRDKEIDNQRWCFTGKSKKTPALGDQGQSSR